MESREAVEFGREAIQRARSCTDIPGVSGMLVSSNSGWACKSDSNDQKADVDTLARISADEDVCPTVDGYPPMRGSKREKNAQ